MKYTVSNISNPKLSAPTELDLKVGTTTLTMVQKGILDAKIKKSVDREEILEENIKGRLQPSTDSALRL